MTSNLSFATKCYLKATVMLPNPIPNASRRTCIIMESFLQREQQRAFTPPNTQENPLKLFFVYYTQSSSLSPPLGFLKVWAVALSSFALPPGPVWGLFFPRWSDPASFSSYHFSAPGPAVTRKTNLVRREHTLNLIYIRTYFNPGTYTHNPEQVIVFPWPKNPRPPLLLLFVPLLSPFQVTLCEGPTTFTQYLTPNQELGPFFP